MTHLTKLVRHCTWANQTWISTLETVAPDDEYLGRMMSHLLLGEQAWFQRIKGEPVERDIWNTLKFVDIQTLQARHVAFYGELLRGDLNRVVAYERFTTGERYQSPIADILLHLCTHGAHHRGQMAAYASGRGFTPPNVDYINFCIVHGL